MADLQEELLHVLTSFTGTVVAQSILRLSISMAGVEMNNLSGNGPQRLTDCIEQGIKTFIHDPQKREACAYKVRQAIRSSAPPSGPRVEADQVAIADESDILRARTIGHALIKGLGFSSTDQTKIVTVISELARNIFAYAGNGTITLTRLNGGIPGVEVVAHDSGPGIEDLETIMAGQYHSTSGLGIGLAGSKRLMDEFSIQTAPGRGTTVTARKFLH